MGCFCSTAVDKRKSNDIDKYLSDEKRKVTAKELKILLLGAGESGKSTFIKQMKIIHMNGFSKDELMEYRAAVHKNVFESLRQLIEGADRLKMIQNEETQRNLEQLRKACTQATLHSVINPQQASIIKQVWQSEETKALIERTSDFYLMDSAAYFFDAIDRITSSDYIPTEDDVLRARTKSTGISETKFSIDKLNITMYDVGGQRSERKKWIHCFEGVTSVMFFVALSEYDQVLLEDSSQNRMAESLVLFESIVNSKWFVKSSIILFLNKIDLFKEKLKKVPLQRYFPEYAGDDDFTKASKFMLWRFKQVNRQNLLIYPHLTCATDTKQIRVVFSAVKDTLIKNSLKDFGMM